MGRKRLDVVSLCRFRLSDGVSAVRLFELGVLSGLTVIFETVYMCTISLSGVLAMVECLLLEDSGRGLMIVNK